MKARELAAKYGYEIGCGDNSCWFGSPGGMGTNGGCRCWPRAHARNVTEDELQQMRKLSRDLAAILSAIAKGDKS
jgi:hypothetical protein